MTKPNLTPKERFNALSNATHIFALKEEKVKFTLLEVVNGEEDTKAIAVTEDGEVIGIYTDSRSARSALNDVINAFGNDQPLISVHTKETKSKLTVYYIEVE